MSRHERMKEREPRKLVRSIYKRHRPGALNAFTSSPTTKGRGISNEPSWFPLRLFAHYAREARWGGGGNVCVCVYKNIYRHRSCWTVSHNRHPAECVKGRAGCCWTTIRQPMIEPIPLHHLNNNKRHLKKKEHFVIGHLCVCRLCHTRRPQRLRRAVA